MMFNATFNNISVIL